MRLSRRFLVLCEGGYFICFFFHLRLKVDKFRLTHVVERSVLKLPLSFFLFKSQSDKSQQSKILNESMLNRSFCSSDLIAKPLSHISIAKCTHTHTLRFYTIHLDLRPFPSLKRPNENRLFSIVRVNESCLYRIDLFCAFVYVCTIFSRSYVKSA